MSVDWYDYDEVLDAVTLDGLCLQNADEDLQDEEEVHHHNGSSS